MAWESEFFLRKERCSAALFIFVVDISMLRSLHSWIVQRIDWTGQSSLETWNIFQVLPLPKKHKQISHLSPKLLSSAEVLSNLGLWLQRRCVFYQRFSQSPPGRSEAWNLLVASCGLGNLEPEFAVFWWGFLAPLILWALLRFPLRFHQKTIRVLTVSRKSWCQIFASPLKSYFKRRFPSYFRVLQVGFNDFSAMAKFWWEKIHGKIREPLWAKIREPLWWFVEKLKEMTVVTYNAWESWPMSAVKIFGGHPPSRGSQKNFDLGGRRLGGTVGLADAATDRFCTLNQPPKEQWTLGASTLKVRTLGGNLLSDLSSLPNISKPKYWKIDNATPRRF